MRNYQGGQMMVEQLCARILRARQMDGSAFEEVRDDASFTPVGAGLAAVAILLAGIGAYCWPEVNDEFKPSGYFFDTVILGTILTLALWLRRGVGGRPFLPPGGRG